MQFDRLKRREFITLLGGAAAAWPLAIRAQQSAVPVIGFLSSLSQNDLGLVIPGFLQGLNGAGLIEGRSIAIEYRWAEGDYQRLPALAGDLVNRKVAVIAAISGTPAALAAKAATTAIPIVFAIGGDPVAPGLVPNLNRPGGNVTGVSFYNSPVVTKRLDLARELVPDGSVIALLGNPENPASVEEAKAAEAAAAALGQRLLILNASTLGQIDDAFATCKQQQVRALITSSDPVFFSERVKLVVLMARDAIPTIFAESEQARAGGLISYGASRADAYRQAGSYVGRIVKGEKPADLPVTLPTKFHILVNLKTAKSLHIDIPGDRARARRRGDRVKRREFVTLLAGAAAVWPLAARAQQPERMRRIGVLLPATSDDPDYQAWLGAFQQGLAQSGWFIGRNVRIDTRWAGGKADDVRRHAAELVALAPDVILAHGTSTVRPLLQATRTIPIVFPIAGDPVGAGFVDSLAHPGGNVTGFMTLEYSFAGKWLELLKEIAPGVMRAAVLRDGTQGSGTSAFAVIQAMGPLLGVGVTPVNLRDGSEIEHAIAAFARSANGGLIVTPGGSAATHRSLIIALAARHKLPAVYPGRHFVTGGGLISYEPDFVDQYQRAAGYVDRILKGEKPADLPVQAPTKYELVINLKTAKALGIDVPQQLLARADEVIE